MSRRIAKYAAYIAGEGRIYEYNTQEVDRVLDKMIEVGYDGLTDEEKKILSSTGTPGPETPENAPEKAPVKGPKAKKEVDRVLDKMIEVGYDGLTDIEKEILDNPETSSQEILKKRAVQAASKIPKEFIAEFFEKIFMIVYDPKMFEEAEFETPNGTAHLKPLNMGAPFYGNFINLRQFGRVTTRPIIRVRILRFYGIDVDMTWMDKGGRTLTEILQYVHDNGKGGNEVDRTAAAQDFFKKILGGDFDKFKDKKKAFMIPLSGMLRDPKEETFKKLIERIKEVYGKDIQLMTLAHATLYDLLTILSEESDEDTPE